MFDFLDSLVYSNNKIRQYNSLPITKYIELRYSELFLKFKNNPNNKIIQATIKQKLRVDFDTTNIIITGNIIIFVSETPKNLIEEKININYGIKAIHENTYLIDVNQIQFNSDLSEKILDVVHAIGVKYINGESLSENFKINNDLSEKIMEQFENSTIDINDCECQFDEHDIALIFNTNEKISKEELCEELGLKPSLFTEVMNINRNIYTIVLICSCPRIVFEEFFDKQENCNADGVNKWLL